MKTLQPLTSPMVLSISGGVDSMVLLSLATHPDTVVVHFHHGLRETATLDAALVKKAAQDKGFRYIEIPLTLDPSQNIQDQARNLRYQHLVQVAKENNLSTVALAHHGDDLIESMMLHLLRGTSLKGLQLRDRFVIDSVTLIRPFLPVDKQTLLTYAKEHSVAYREDESNESDRYLRNRIRHHIIPLLYEEQPQLLDKFTQLSDQVQLLLPYLDEQTQDVFDQPSRKDYQQLAPVLQRHVLSRWLDQYDISAHQELLHQMNKALQSDTPHLSVQLSQAVSLQTSYDQVRFVTNVTDVEFTQKINAPGTYETLNHGIVIVTTDPSSSDQMDVIMMDEDDLFEFELRTRKPGDLVHLTGGRKKLKDWLIDLKMDLEKRNELLVLAKNQHVLWIPALHYTTSQKGSTPVYCSWRPKE